MSRNTGKSGLLIDALSTANAKESNINLGTGLATSRGGRHHSGYPAESSETRENNVKSFAKGSSTASGGSSSINVNPHGSSSSDGLKGEGSPRKSDRTILKGNRAPTSIQQNSPRTQEKSNFDQIPNAPQSAHQRPTESYGIMYSLKSTFGFIQPIFEEEQIYCSSRDYFDDIKLGDRVGFIWKTSSKGDYAEKLRHLTHVCDKLMTGLKGQVTRASDIHRSGYGLLEIETSTLSSENLRLLQSIGYTKGPNSSTATKSSPAFREVPFRQADYITTGQFKGRRLEKGDYVEFSVSRIGENSAFLQATSIKLLQLKRDRAIANQIQRMLDAGAVLETGTVCTIKRAGDFGFIKALNRKEEVFFKLDDVADLTSGTPIKEGTDVEFFVIAESNRGKLSDRAIHLKALPPGSVKFEITVAKKVLATVIQNCESHPEESPGMLRLHSPVSIKEVTGKEDDVMEEVELWQRCLPEEFQCRVGDVVSLDVHYYRPEKLYFARSVRIKTFRQLGRETGRIVAVKGQGFGFLHSQIRNTDIYFKSTLVVGPSGSFVDEAALQVDALVSFEVSVESTKGGIKYRAHRVLLLLESDSSSAVLKKDVIGVVIRNAKREAAGVIKVCPEHTEELKNIKAVDPDILKGLKEFAELPQLKKVSMFGSPSSVQRSYINILESGDFPLVAYELSFIDDNDPSLGKEFSVVKLSESDYVTWLKGKEKSSASNKEKTDNSKQKDVSDNIHFQKEDYVSEDFGPLANDLIVRFDACWDDGKAKLTAKNIRLTDEAIEDGDKAVFGVLLGVIDVLMDSVGGGKSGFIRCLESDERLFWFLSSSSYAAIKAQGKAVSTSLFVGSEVSFSLRRRGGLRCAVDLKLLEVGALKKEVELPFECTGMVVEKQQLVLVDVSRNELLARRYVDLKLLNDLMIHSKEHKNGDMSDGNTSAATWEKRKGQPILPSDKSSVAAKNVAIDSKLAAVDSEDSKLVDGGSNVFQREYKPQYFPCIPRLALPLSPVSGNKHAVGTVVNCLVSVNWFLQRSPLFASIVSVNLDQKAIKKKGRIVRLKFRSKGSESSPANAVEFVEIFDLEERSKDYRQQPSEAAAGGPVSGPTYYCDMREVQYPPEENSKEGSNSLQYGDEVEFWCIPAVGNIAFHVTVLPKLSSEFGKIQFNKRPVVNAELKEKSMVNLIVMAKGPPNEAAVGFEDGWRKAFSSSDSVAVIQPPPWASLLNGTYKV
mmetsp:Transcript_31176/g.42895  ORF Transcript_31176/g.42895 Transcript_31176/m.42895 type:complete len:1222 (+) Transcript_31176:112-3777(+)